VGVVGVGVEWVGIVLVVVLDEVDGAEEAEEEEVKVEEGVGALEVDEGVCWELGVRCELEATVLWDEEEEEEEEKEKEEADDGDGTVGDGRTYRYLAQCRVPTN
jgi:hypothetical protein